MNIIKSIIYVAYGLFAFYIVIGLIINTETMLFALAVVSFSIALGIGVFKVLVYIVRGILKK